jgi:hypothetical protein
MKDTLDKLAAVASALSAAKKDLDAIEMPSLEQTHQTAHQMNEVFTQYRDTNICLVRKQALFLNVLLTLTIGRSPEPRYLETLQVGEHTLIYYSHAWCLKSGKKCLSFFGAGEHPAIFKSVCETLIAKVLAFPESIPAEALQEAIRTFTVLQTTLQPVFVKGG